jgi:hypothetical protein
LKALYGKTLGKHVPGSADPKYNWANWGIGIHNDRWARYETKINASNAGRLTKKRGWPVRVSPRASPD